ncbi:TIGR04141 family sporadically distributed protein [Halomonas elongata]|uniref:TIGR04141 family sporadically distributed protein n=1 Tax=Halomonas elongata TaxID=2746 RepID=UPI0023AE753C|nr:TIGR04141 family sporadically distributed protein [Halomonas elongata]
MPEKKPYRRLNVLLAKDEFSGSEYRDLLSPDAKVSELAIEEAHDFDGVIYVKNQEEKRPRWAPLIDTLAGTEVDQLSNRSSSAVFLIRVDRKVLAFTFGYGRFLLNLGCFQQDFGLKTALNTLNHQSLRSVDLHTLEDQPIQKRSQAARGSEASVFGIDIFRDVLRAVTGSPRSGVGFNNISGGDAIYSFSQEMLVEEMPRVASQLIYFYELDLYKSSFGWVDNIRRIKDGDTISALDGLLLDAVKNKDPGLIITLSEVIEWDKVLGFSFTRSKKDMTPTIDADQYLNNVDTASVSIESIKRDRLFVTDVHENEFGHSVYSCLYLELDSGDTKNVIFGGNWYEIGKSFMNGVDSTLAMVALSDLEFPGVYVWEEGGKVKIETEGDYNERAAVEQGFFLLDKKLVKCTQTTSPIELCDLLTQDKQLVHVKHRKGGSAGLSHLFSQGSVSAEVMLGDKEFRKKARTVLRRVNPRARDLVPLNSIRSSEYEVIFLILGADGQSLKESLPFFSKVNLTRVYENLSQRGFTVKIAGASQIERDHA